MSRSLTGFDTISARPATASRCSFISASARAASPFASAMMIERCSLTAHSEECGRLYSASVRPQRDAFSLT